jgi:hypothetical protein
LIREPLPYSPSHGRKEQPVRRYRAAIIWRCISPSTTFIRPPSTVRTDNTPELHFSATLGEEPVVEVALF